MGAAANATPKQREKMDAEIFCGSGRTFPIQDAGDIRSAARLIGKADDPEAVKRCIVRKAKNIPGGMDAVPDAWKPAKKDVTMDTLVHFGGAVKALGNGRVGGYLVTFGDETTPDLSPQRDFFTANTDYGLEETTKSAVYYAHGLDGTLKTRRLMAGEMKQDEVGVWVEGQLKMRDEYEKAVYKMAEEGRLGWSSGTASHLVTRKAIKTDSGTVHEILTWPLGLDASLTPTPADPRSNVVALKSLPPLIGFDKQPEDDTTKTLPNGFTYRDLIRFLESELNEDFGRQGGYDVLDSYTPSIYYWVENLRENPDTVIYHRSDESGDTFSRPYTVANNDAVWGDEQEVIETTTYVDAPNDDAMPTIKEIKTESAPATLPFGEHLDTALAAVAGVIERGFDINDLRIKSGRVLSAANRSKLKEMHTQMQTAHAAMASHIAKMGDLLAATDPDAKKDVEDFAALRTQFVKLQSELLHLSG